MPQAKQKFNAFTFIVTGSGHFPVDMMRYDRCVPKTQDDISLAFSRRDDRRVEVIAFTISGNKLEPTIQRWLSFGWPVVAGSVKPVLA